MERASVPSSIKILGLDADDTLWQNQDFYRLTQDRFADMLSAYMPPTLCTQSYWPPSDATWDAVTGRWKKQMCRPKAQDFLKLPRLKRSARF